MKCSYSKKPVRANHYESEIPCGGHTFAVLGLISSALRLKPVTKKLHPKKKLTLVAEPLVVVVVAVAAIAASGAFVAVSAAAAAAGAVVVVVGAVAAGAGVSTATGSGCRSL